MKKGLLAGLAVMGVLALSACGNSGNTTSKTEKAKDVTSSKTVKKSSKKSSSSKKTSAKETVTVPTDDTHDWFFKDDIFYAGMETYKLTKSEIRDSSESGKKVLVIYTDVTNNSKKEQDPSNVYMVVEAKQKTDTSNVSLNPGSAALNDDATNPLQQYEDNLHNDLLPGKTVTGVLVYSLINDSPVTVTFSNADFQTLGTKEYQVK